MSSSSSSSSSSSNSTLSCITCGERQNNNRTCVICSKVQCMDHYIQKCYACEHEWQSELCDCDLTPLDSDDFDYYCPDCFKSEKKGSSKRKAEDPIESLDQEASKEAKIESSQPQEIKLPKQEIVFEPEFLSDFNIIYNNTTYKCHRYALISRSDYFKTMLVNDKECKELTFVPFTFPSYFPFASELVHGSFTSFLETLHKDTFSYIPTHPYDLYLQWYYFNYFQVTILIIKKIDALCSGTDFLTTLANSEVLIYYIVAEQFKWKKEVYKALCTFIASNMYKFMNAFKTDPVVKVLWNALSQKAERHIYTSTIQICKGYNSYAADMPTELLPQ